MAARKAVRQLRVALSPGTEKLESVKKELEDKGHEVVVIPELADYDLVLGANAHRLNKTNEKLLSVVIKATRARRYGAKGSNEIDDYQTEG